MTKNEKENENDIMPDQPVEAEIVEEESEGLESVGALEQELSEARARADEYLDGWQRSRAEFANYKKRVDREQAQAYQMAAGNIIRRYLDVLDDMERALKNRPQEGDGASWANGIELIYRKLLNIVESEGVKPMEAQGQLFDPNLHEAISSEESDDHESGQIIEVLQQGYLIGDRILRPAVVRVAR
jgi:molecular chaperone GrpE